MKTLARARDAAEIVERLRRLRPDSQRRWGRMTAHQMVCHLGDGCRMALGHREVSPASSLLERSFWKWVALYAPVPWPPGIVTRPEIDQAAGGGTCPGDFEADVAETTRLVTLLAGQRGLRWPAHPIFGKMSERDWLRWGYLHPDHHLRQFGV